LGMPYQNLINLFLRDCALQKRRPVIQWPGEPPKRAVGAGGAPIPRSVRGAFKNVRRS
jgi:hypothetical protein